MTKQLLTFIFIFQLFVCNTAKPADKMEWWKNAKFGMFIHWGLYSIPAGEWKGKKTKIGETTEWIESYMKIPVADYKSLAERFNPTLFNADDFVRIAREAGMKYIVLTSKHHEGFAMFKSSDPFNVVDATPYKKDIVLAISEACKKQGMHFGLYYSQAQDWNHEGGIACSGHWDPAQDGSFDKYLDEVAVPQINEILSTYKPEILWWDTPCEMTKERAAKFTTILTRYPNLIVNNRLCEGISGDLETPEQFIPATGFPGKNWESCMTMNTTWGFGANDHNWKSAEVLVRNLIDIASKGGNYLLNVGPTSMGFIPEPSIERLKEIGAWMKNNGEAIYGTSASPFKKLNWGRCTTKKSGGKNLFYLHVFDLPVDGILNLPGLSGTMKEAWLLKNKEQKFQVIKDGNYVNINLSGVEKENFATVIVLETGDDAVVYNSPEINAEYSVFIKEAAFTITSDIPNCVIRFTTDGSIPTMESPVANGLVTVNAKASFSVRALCFLNNKAVSGMSEIPLAMEKPLTPAEVPNTNQGLTYSYFEGVWGQLPDFFLLKPILRGVTSNIDLTIKKRNSDYALLFKGYLKVPETGVYQFLLSSNDGSRMCISGKTLSNDGLHGMQGKSMDVSLAKGLHPVEIQFFQAGGGDGLSVEWKTRGKAKAVIEQSFLVH